MNEVKKTLVGESNPCAYVSPEVKVLNIQLEGVLCSSVFKEHEDFTFDQGEDL